MGSSAEREQYFQKVLAHQRAVGHKMQELFHALKDLGMEDSLDEIFADERRQNSVAMLLYWVLQGVSEEESQEYTFIRRFLDSILPQDTKEKRRYVREPFLGLIRLRDLETGTVYRVKCMDVSPGGVGIESDRVIPLGHSFRIELSLYKYPTTREHTGKLVWLKEIIPGTFVGGMQFSTDGYPAS